MDENVDVLESELMNEVATETTVEENKKETLIVDNKEDYLEIPDWDLTPPFDTVDRGEL